ncbi:MAG: YdjY domain-containing protein [Planctomycetota bacterium]
MGTPALLWALALAGLWLAPLPRGAAQATSASTSASRPAEPVLFQPGVRLDWSRREVLVDTQVVLRSGPLEFLACWPGKEHESILRFRASATHVYQAAGLMGIDPGRPPTWNDERRAFDPPTGDLVDIALRWQEDGLQRSADAYDWLREIEYARTPLPRPWYFCGSHILPGRTLSAESSGVGIALVDFPDSLISFSRQRPSRYGELWAEVNTPAVPPEGTAVRLVLRAARPLARSVDVDFRGVIRVDGRFCTPADLADLLKLARQRAPEAVQTLHAGGTLAADRAELDSQLECAGAPAGSWRWSIRPVSGGRKPDGIERRRPATQPAAPAPDGRPG